MHIFNYRIYAIHSRTSFSYFSLFGATIFQVYEVKSATMFRGRLCFKGDYVLRKYGSCLSIVFRFDLDMNYKDVFM